MPTRTVELARVPEYARWAEEAGFDSVWDYEIYRNPFTMLSTAALSTDRTILATGLAAAFSRSPFEFANAAADVDELSGGRMLIGMGTGVPEFLAAFHSQGFDEPLSRMRDYVNCLRRSWEYLNTGDAAPYAGRHYRFTAPRFNPWGLRPLARPQIPVYIASLAPKMTALAGEIGDGWLSYLATPRWVSERARPWLEEGAARSGRDLADFETAVEVICSVNEDREVAYRRARIYVSHPVSDPVIALHGLEAERDAVRHGLATRGPEALAETSDRLVEAFSITGTPDEARDKLADWTPAIQHLVLHTPYVPPLSTEQAEDAFLGIVETFGRTGAPLRHHTGSVVA
jgi:probable F420-dependent oxidoreductase